jgi:hypothetical protein
MNSSDAAPRNAFSWPAGSIRALLTLMIVGLICAILLIPHGDKGDKPVPIPAYLIYLLFLAVGHYFAHRSHARGSDRSLKHQPLWLPRGSVRLLVLGGLTGACVYCYVTDPEGFTAQWRASMQSLPEYPLLPVLVLLGFLFGAVLRMLIGAYAPPFWQDLEAWLSLIAVLLMVVATMIHLVINPSLSQELNLPVWEVILATVVAFYFGERS